jgi:fucose permease
MTIGRFAGDHLAHRYGAEQLMRNSAWLAMAGLAAAAVFPSEAVTIVAFLVAGLGIATLTPRLYDLAARAGAGSASGLGVLTAGIRTATIVVPATIAGIASATTVGVAIAIAGVAAGVVFQLATRPAATRRARNRLAEVRSAADSADRPSAPAGTAAPER